MESSENYFTLLARVTEDGSRKPYKRLGSWNGEIAAKKTRPGKIIDEELSQDLTDDKQPQHSLESPDNNSPILPVESMENFPNPLSSASDIARTTFQYFSRRSEKRELDPDFLCLSMKKLKLCEFETTKMAQEDGSCTVDQELISNTESTFLEKSENLKVSRIKSVEKKGQLCLVENSDENFKENSCSNPDDACHMQFGLDEDDEPGGFSFEERMFSTSLHSDLDLEDKLLFEGLKNVFKNKLKNSTNQTESLVTHETFDSDEFINIDELYSEDCSELNIFEDQFNNTWFNSNSTSEAQCQKLDTTEESVTCASMSTTNGIKEKKCTINSPSSASLDEKDKDHLHIGKITKAVECFNSSTSGKEDSSKQRSDDSKEMEEIPSLLSFIQESGPETVIKSLTKNKEINILEANQLPSLKKSISFHPKTYRIFPTGMKNVMKLYGRAPAESKISGIANISTNGTK